MSIPESSGNVPVMAEHETELPLDDDDDNSADLFDKDNPPRLGQDWTPAMHRIADKASKELMARRRESEASEDDEE